MPLDTTPPTKRPPPHRAPTPLLEQEVHRLTNTATVTIPTSNIPKLFLIGQYDFLGQTAAAGYAGGYDQTAAAAKPTAYATGYTQRAGQPQASATVQYFYIHWGW